MDASYRVLKGYVQTLVAIDKVEKKLTRLYDSPSYEADTPSGFTPVGERRHHELKAQQTQLRLRLESMNAVLLEWGNKRFPDLTNFMNNNW